MLVGILGGTGPAGKGAAARFAAAGHEVVIGSRKRERAEDTVAALAMRNVTAATNEEAAAAAEIVVLAVPWEGAVALAESLAPQLAGKVLVSMVNAIAFYGKRPEPLLPASGSIALGLQSRLPKVRVVASMHHLPAHVMVDLDESLDFDVLTVGDDDEAVDIAMRLVDSIEGLRAVHSGGLQNSTALEALTPVLIEINIRHKARTSIRIVGLND